jgi:hypothetical protein
MRDSVYHALRGPFLRARLVTGAAIPVRVQVWWKIRVEKWTNPATLQAFL